MKFRLADVRPNPFRDLEFNPYDESTIQGLTSSIEDTGFWANVMARAVDGGAEIAYGHHRVEAARRLFGEDFEIDLALAELDDQTMLKMMIAENVHQRGVVAANEFEIARAYTRAVADGRIEVAPYDETSNRQIRLAPGFVRVTLEEGEAPDGIAYTVDDIAAFFGWDRNKISYIFGALELDEGGILPLTELMGMSTSAVRQLVESSRTRLREAQQSERRDEERLKELEERVQDVEDEEIAEQLADEIQQVKAVRDTRQERARRDVEQTARVVREKLDQDTMRASDIKDVARAVEIRNRDEDDEDVGPVVAKYVRSQRGRVERMVSDLAGEQIGALAEVAPRIVAEGGKPADALRATVANLRQLAERAGKLADDIDAAFGHAPAQPSDDEPGQGLLG